MSADRRETLLTHVGRDPFANHGVVNPPVYHASTILYPTLAALEEAERTPYEGTRYGRRGTPTTFALEEAVAALEGGYRAIAAAVRARRHHHDAACLPPQPATTC